MKTPLTLFQRHVKRWRDCTACPLHEGRKQVVLCRGVVPCTILFLGEAPGESEDVIGQPFVGPAGRLLDHIIKRSLPEGIRVAFTNLVACVPRDEEGGKTSEPEDAWIRACAPRLQEFVELADPKLIVCVGKLAKEWTEPGYKHAIGSHKRISMVHIKHPAAILRAHQAQQGMDVQRCEITLRDAVEEFRK